MSIIRRLKFCDSYCEKSSRCRATKMLFVFLFCLLFGFKVNAGQFPPENVSIVIIGAGPSGIAAATRLWEHGLRNIQILEAENRVGGRINSVKFGDSYTDLGAQWCHGQGGNIVYSLVKDLNILKRLHLSHRFISSKGEYLDKELSRDIFRVTKNVDASEMSPEYARTCQNVTSTGECVRQNFDSVLAQKYKQDPLKSRIVNGSLDWMQAYINSYDACFNWDDLYIRSDYKRCEGDLFLSWNGRGYRTILEVMLKKFPNPSEGLPIDDNIHLNSEVETITNWDGENRTTIRTTDGRTFEADIVLFTPSAGVLKADHETLFEPNLPEEKVKAIEAVGFGAILKIVLRFSERWWEENTAWWPIWIKEDKEEIKEKCPSCVTKSGKLWITYMAGLRPQANNPTILTGWFAGDVVPEVEQLEDGDIIDGIDYGFQMVFGGMFNVTRPVEIIKTTWYSNPHFRGSYSYESARGHRTLNKIPDKLRSPLVGRNGRPSVFFAGEATHPHYFSTVHGAIETGYREAEAILKLTNRSR